MRKTLMALSLVLLLAGCSGDAPVERLPTPAEPAPQAEAAQVEAPPPKLNVNTATNEEFLALPEVSDRMAHEFDEYRPYASIRQFRREIGKYVDQAQVARYEQHLFVPIAINECDEETLQQIPGVDGTVAAAIVAGRPYADANAALDALTAYVDAEAVEIARGYLAE